MADIEITLAKMLEKAPLNSVDQIKVAAAEFAVVKKTPVWLDVILHMADQTYLVAGRFIEPPPIEEDEWLRVDGILPDGESSDAHVFKRFINDCLVRSVPMDAKAELRLTLAKAIYRGFEVSFQNQPIELDAGANAVIADTTGKEWTFFFFNEVPFKFPDLF